VSSASILRSSGCYDSENEVGRDGAVALIMGHLSQMHNFGGYGGGFNIPADGTSNWDWIVCHTYHFVNYGQGNASPTVWYGDNPATSGALAAPNTCWSLLIPRPC